MDKIIIEITGDPKGVQSTIDQLEKIGKVDKKNADQFKLHHEQHKQQTKDQFDANTKLTRSFEDLGKGIVAGFAIERVIQFGGECVKAFEEAESASNDLKFAVSNLAKGSGEDFEKLTKQSETLSKSLNTLFSPKEIQKSQTALLQMKLTTEQVATLMPRLLDISAKTHKSLESVSEIFGKAISEGRTGALTQFGSKFKDTGDIIGNFNKVIEKTAGFANGAASSLEDLANKEQEAKNKAELLEEELGSKLAPVWVNLKNRVLEATSALLKFNLADFANLISFGTTKDEIMQKNFYDKVKQMRVEDLASLFKYYEGKIITSEAGDKKLFEDAAKAVEAELALRLSGNKKEVEGETMKVVDLSKLSDKQLEQRLDFAKEEDVIIGKYTTTGFAKEAARIEKEINARKKANEDLLKLEEQYQKDLEAIKKKDADDKAKFTIDAIKDETDKKLAAQDDAFRKEQVEFDEREKKLTEISVKGTKAQKQAALKELQELYKDELLAAQANDKLKEKIQEDADKKAAEEQQKAWKEKLDRDVQNSDIANKWEELELKKKLVKHEISEEKYNEELKRLQLKALEDKLAIENEAGIQDVDLQQQIEDKKLELQKDSNAKLKELAQQAAEGITKVFEAVSESITSDIDVINTQMERQAKLVDVQKALAEAGYENTLAFEAKKADDLEKKKLEEQRKLKKIKELEIFLNAVATYSGEGNNPMQAIGKALAVLAATKTAEAVYAEEGAVIGKHTQTSRVGLNSFSRRHKSGKDYLLHAEEGERVLSVDQNKKFEALGGLNLIRNPFGAKIDRVGQPTYVNNNKELVSEIQDLKQAILNKKETTYAFEDMVLRIEEVENGLKTITRNFRG